jgi:hypothetical protein
LATDRQRFGDLDGVAVEVEQNHVWTGSRQGRRRDCVSVPHHRHIWLERENLAERFTEEYLAFDNI